MATEEEKAYKALIGTIGGHKGYLTRLANNVTGFLEIEPLDGEQQLEAEELRDNIKTRVGKLEEMFDQLLANPHLSEEDITDFEKYIKVVKNKLAKLRFKLQSNKPPPVDSPSPEASKVSGWGESAVKYPEISLPKFRGGESGVQDYRPFVQIFNALVGDKKIFHPYIKSSISGVVFLRIVRHIN